MLEMSQFAKLSLHAVVPSIMAILLVVIIIIYIKLTIIFTHFFIGYHSRLLSIASINGPEVLFYIFLTDVCPL